MYRAIGLKLSPSVCGLARCCAIADRGRVRSRKKCRFLSTLAMARELPITRSGKERAMNTASHCGAMLGHIQQEHRHLNSAIREIRNRFSQLPANSKTPSAPTDVLPMLQRLRTELDEHFAEEEAGGCFEEAATRCPSLLSQVKAITAQHRELIPMFDAVLTRANDPMTSRKQIQRAFEAFALQLYEHENAESRVLQYAFGGEAADYDIEGNE
jgi:hypothetical protein